jgi:hypothetical protein
MQFGIHAALGQSNQAAFPLFLTVGWTLYDVL